MEVYEPKEDSYLLLELVKKHASGKVLEIGTGSGILAIAAARKAKSVVAADINEKALKAAAENANKEKAKIKFVHSDLFENVKGKFDTIIFNPPYLAQDKGIEDRAIYGGKKGHETIERFLDRSSEHLEANGKILLLFSSLTKRDRVDEIIANNCYEYELFSQQSLFFEKLYTYIIKKSCLLKELEKQKIRKIRKLARGHRGIVYTGIYKGKKIAVKAERKDSKAMGRALNEAKWLKTLNKKGIGPKLLFSGKNYFAYQFVEGEFIGDFIKSSGKKEIIDVLKSVMQQCFVLDELKVNKEEMHHPKKHIIVTADKKPVMIDFERCRNSEKPKNVTQFVQFIASGHISEMLREKGIIVDKDTMVKIAQEYSKNHDIRGVMKQFEVTFYSP